MLLDGLLQRVSGDPPSLRLSRRPCVDGPGCARHPDTGGRPACVCLLAVALVPQWTWACKDLPESDRGTAGSCGNSTLNFLRKLHAVFSTGCTILRSNQQCARVPISPRGRQHLLFCYFLFLINSYLNGV